MLSAYAFDSRLIVRTPRLPLPRHISEIDLSALLSDASFLEALYLASPVLYEECIKWREGLITNRKEIEKLTRSIIKYYLRMSSRATPFGLFSGCAVASWSETKSLLIVGSDKGSRHTRLDMHYLCALARHLSEYAPIRERLLFFPNNSLYAVGTELRYVEYLYVEGNRKYRISSVTATDYLERVLDCASKGMSIPQLVDYLMKDEIEANDARTFIGEMIDCQLLVSELEPCITGEEFMEQIITVLERVGDGDEMGRAILSLLREVQVQLKIMDEGLGSGVAPYKAIVGILSRLGVPFAEGKLFQADLVHALGGEGADGLGGEGANGDGMNKGEGGLDKGYQKQIREALDVLNKLAFSKRDTTLQSFAQRFSQRYEHKEMPLMEVLDTEIGIGYEPSGAACMSPLVEDLRFVDLPGQRRMEWSALEELLNEKLKDTLEKNGFALSLTEKELEKFSSDESDLPPSMAVLFRATVGHSLYIESAGGSSAVNLLGRFAHADAAIGKLASDIARYEQEQDPDIIYAEIVHLPESRTGNILLHPVFRDYEIPYLAASSLESDRQIDVKDLYVSVRNGKVILRSKRLNRRVIPRLSTAHNYTNSSLGVYRFLCDLQLQDKKKALGFNWGGLQHQHGFLPRVVYKNTILHLAKWNFLKEDILVFRDQTDQAADGVVRSFRDKWKMPRYVVLSEGDNELLIDLENTASVSLWLESVKNKDGFTIKEFPWPDNIVTDENKVVYANQFVAILTRSGSSYADKKISWPRENRVFNQQREFPLGTEWVYFKLYCGVKSADRLLTQAIAPLVEELSAKDIIDKWFFIRYNDPEFHLRIRLHLKDVANIGYIISALNKQLNSPENIGYVWKLQTDTYKREVERYGCSTMELTEDLFHYDSMACLSMLAGTAGDERETIRWIWALRAVDELLGCFSLDTHEKLSLVQDLRYAFGLEFNVDKTIRTQLNDKYRDNRKMIDTVMKSSEELPVEWQPLIGILKEKSRLLAPVVTGISMLSAEEQDGPSIREMLGSYSHMMLNRIITTEARTHELVIYDFLVRYYKSQIARDGEMEPKKRFVLSNE
jgi:thiopeptide-type bacteriocin biosynthesis protein